MEHLVGIVLAAGHGSVTTAKESKLIQPVGGEPMVRAPVRLLRDGLGIKPTLVVINSRFGDHIRHALSEHPDEWFVYQEQRTGTAGATKECLPHIACLAPESRHAVVLYGDMPRWKAATIRGLVRHHVSQGNTITMFRIEVSGSMGGCFTNYGRILYDGDGRIIAVREPYEMSLDEVAQARYVSPSAWVFELRWLVRHLHDLRPHDRGDGFAHEYFLPDLVPLALRENKPVGEVDLPDAREALGVNTAEELQQVRACTE